LPARSFRAGHAESFRVSFSRHIYLLSVPRPQTSPITITDLRRPPEIHRPHIIISFIQFNHQHQHGHPKLILIHLHPSSNLNTMMFYSYWLIICLAYIVTVHSFSTTHRYSRHHGATSSTNTIIPSWSRRHGHLASLPPTLETLVADTLDSDRKIVVVTGGVLSGIGKGVTASSIGVVSAIDNCRRVTNSHILHIKPNIIS